MLELAIGGNEAFKVCRLEIDRGGISYTVDTLAELKRQDSSRELFFLVGADSLDDLPQWREPARICQLAMPVAVSRPGAGPPNYEVLAPLVSKDRLEEIRHSLVEMPQIGLSSREIRSRVAAGSSIRYQTPRAVEKYIATHGLYRKSDAAEVATAGRSQC
jgi:nicotinate-nucleotide adenylyltransferase